nr:sensor histidine kinase [Cohnella sp. REN36]
MQLRGKIVLFYGLIVFIPTVLLAVGAGLLTFHSVRDNYLLTIKEAVRQTAQSIDFRKQSYDLLATRTATDGELVSRLSRDYTDMLEQLETVNYVDRSLPLTAKYLPGIEDFRIYHTNDSLVQDGGMLWKPEDRMPAGIRENDWYEQTLASPDILSWSNARNDPRKLIVSCKIMDRYARIYGVIYLLLDYNDVFAELFNHPFSGAGDLYIVDKNEHIIASSESSEIGNRLSSSSLESYWAHQNQVSAPINGKVLIVQKLSDGWSVAALVHIDQMEEQTKRIYYTVGIGIAFFLLISIFLVMTVLKNVVRRIRKLGHRMTDISQGVFDVTVKNRDRDELGELEVLFNSMSSRLGRLVEENTQANLMEREQSFKALQAQINPHFIYNSLSLIRWRAMDLQDEMQLRTIDALTTFYRLALNNRVNATRIRDEVEHLKAYLEIQELRYPGRVGVRWEIEDDTLELYTIKLLLQPIVENCYLHGGITSRPDAIIRIAIRREEETVHFSVSDNGKGMKPDVLERVRAGSYEGTNNGFGMNNIRERLLLYFGPEGRLDVDSVWNEGTTVSIRIPVCEERPELRRGEGI